MYLYRLLVGGAFCVGCGVPVALGVLKGEGFRAGEFVFSKSSAGGA